MDNNLITMFLSFLKIGLFSIGGGYAIIPLIQEQVVLYHNWITSEEFADIITISQMTPGPLAVNTASFVGIRIAGTSGAIVATLGCILPGFIISIFLYEFFKKYEYISSVSNVLKGLLSTSIGLIASSAISIILGTFFNHSLYKMLNLNMFAVLFFIISLFVLRKYKINPMLVIFLNGLIGVFLYM